MSLFFSIGCRTSSLEAAPGRAVPLMFEALSSRWAARGGTSAGPLRLRALPPLRGLSAAGVALLALASGLNFPTTRLVEGLNYPPPAPPASAACAGDEALRIAVLADAPFAWWRLSETSGGTAYDCSYTSASPAAYSTNAGSISGLTLAALGRGLNAGE